MKSRYIVITGILTLLMVVIAGCSQKSTAPAARPSAAPAPAAPETSAPAAEQPASETTAPAESETTSEVPVAESTLGQGEDVTQQKLDTKVESGLASDVSASSDVFSEVGCADGRITVKFTNTDSKAWYIVHKGVPTQKDVYNVHIMNRGVVDIEPGCTAYSLEPGDSVVCSEINMGAVMPGDNRVSVNTPSGTVAKIVQCP